MAALSIAKNHGVMWQKDRKDIVSVINLFLTLSLTSSLLGDVKNVSGTKVALPPLNVL